MIIQPTKIVLITETTESYLPSPTVMSYSDPFGALYLVAAELWDSHNHLYSVN